MKKTILSLLLLVITGFINYSVAQAVVPGRASQPDSAAKIKRFQDNIEKLTEDLKHASNDGKSPANIHMLIGINELNLRQYRKALDDFSVAIKLYPGLKEVYPFRAAAYDALKDYPAAIAEWERCFVFVSDNKGATAVIYSNIGKLQLKLQQYDKAIKSDSAAITLAPFFSEVYLYRAWSYAGAGKDALAILDYTVAMGGFQNNNKRLSIIFSGRADSKFRLKKYKDALNDYNSSIELNPNNKSAIWQRAACYYYNGDYQLANNDFNKLIIYYKGDNQALAKLYDDRAMMEMGLQQFQKAIADDSVSISINKQYGIAYWHLADAYSQNADFQLSIDGYNKTIKFFENDKKSLAVIYNNIANEEYFISDFQKVIDYSSSSIYNDAKSWSPYLNRGRAYLKKKDRQHAMDDFNKVLELDSTKTSYEYAFALFYTGNPDKAIDVMRKNVIATTNDPVLMSHYYNIACLYSLMNKPDDANIYLRKCIDAGYPKKYALADPDLENIRNTQEYKDMIK